MSETGINIPAALNGTSGAYNAGSAPALLREVPPILRARGWRLYAEGGRRIVDLWQYGGRALLGHNPPGLLRTIKNIGSRGLFAPLPHYAEGRLLKALSALFPRRVFRLYPGEVSRSLALTAAGYTGILWRPFGDETEQNAPDSTPVLVPVLPFPFPGAPAALVLDPALDGKFPPSPVLSPAALIAAARCVWDLLAAPDRGKPKFPKLDRALTQNCFWKRRGIYLTGGAFAGDAADVAVSGTAAEGSAADAAAAITYASLFRRFLEGGFLLPPQPEESAILPGELSPGEEAKLAGLAAGLPKP